LVTILITGGTGLIGGATAALLAENYLPSLRFLVRAASESDGVARIRTSLARFELDGPALDRIGPEQIVLGDLADVGGFASHASLDSVTHVVNSAAVASFGDNPAIWPVNVVGTLEFARRMGRVAGLRRFLHVGTAMACGSGRTSPILEDLPSQEHHLVKYTASKAEAERLIRHEVPELPFVVARPSIVVGHSRLGCKPSTSIFWVFRMGQDIEHFMCEPDAPIDVVPVDYCASALVHLLLRDRLLWDLYHISAGTDRGVSFRQIDQAMALARNIRPVGNRYRRISMAEIRPLLPFFQERLGIRNRKLILRAMALYGSFSALNYLFDNTRLRAEGLPLPPRFTEYIGNCVRTTEDVPLTEQMLDDFK
jgi:nucleoside-diphosphate-sugar epimerase